MVCMQTVTHCIPNKIFLLDITIAEMKKRLAQETRVADRYDTMTTDFHERIREGYLAEWMRDPIAIERINGERDKEQITQEIVEKILTLL